MPCGLPTRSTICGRSMITRRSPAARMLYAERSPCTTPSCTIVASASRSWSKYDASSAGSGRVWASRGAVSPSYGDPLHQDLGAVDLHGVGDRQPERPEAA